MKKLISLFVLAGLLILPANPIFAANETVSFFDALGSFSKVEDYKLVQSFYGNAQIDNGTDSIGAEFRISVNSAMDGAGATRSFNRINAYLKFTNRNTVTESTPFKEMTMQASAELTSINQTDLYFKLTNFSVGLKDALPLALTDIENVKSTVEPFKGVWYHAGTEELVANSLPADTGAPIDVAKYVGFEEQFKTQPKEAILGLAEMALNDSGSELTDQDKSDIQEAIKLALETKFFTERPIIAGQNVGFTFFNLNKSSIISFLDQFATIIGEDLTTDDATLVRSVLSKVSLSGLYRTDKVYGLIDNFLVRFKITETGPVKNLELNYRYKASDLNKSNIIKVPSEFLELSDVMSADTNSDTSAEPGF